MLGYYADNLFQNDDACFRNCIEFLVKGLAMEKELKSLSLQCADTLKTIIGDEDLVTRVEIFISALFPILSEMVNTMDQPSFYEILMTIISSYAATIDSRLINLLQSLVARVEKEYKELQAKNQKNNMTINQCWNVIRAICEQEAFFPEHMDKIELSLLPMFNYLVNPQNIEFDDDMIQAISTLIKRRQSVSENMAKLFPFLQNFFTKYNHSFGSLLQCLNCFIYYGKDLMAKNPTWITNILEISVMSMFNTNPQVELNNTEGAILCQMLFQNIGNHVLDAYIPKILQKIVERLNAQPQADYLERQLYNVILCAICNNGELTLQTLENSQVTVAIIQAIIKSAEKYQVSYDRKVLVIGLANIFTMKAVPTSVQTILPQILDTIITCLQKQTSEETKKMIKADKKVISLEESESDSDSSEEEEKTNEMDVNEEKRPKDESESDDDLPKDPLSDVFSIVKHKQ
jgi:importin-8